MSGAEQLYLIRLDSYPSMCYAL